MPKQQTVFMKCSSCRGSGEVRAVTKMGIPFNDVCPMCDGEGGWYVTLGYEEPDAKGKDNPRK